MDEIPMAALPTSVDKACSLKLSYELAQFSRHPFSSTSPMLICPRILPMNSRSPEEQNRVCMRGKNASLIGKLYH